MFAKLSKYSIEIIVGVVIFAAIIYFLPGNRIDIPTIDDLALSGVDLNFVMDDENADIIDTGVVIDIVETGGAAGVITSGYMVTGSVDDFIDDAIGLPTIEDSELQQPILEPTQTYSNCALPRGGNISHGESIIAYQQRSDDPGTCNVQRRVCSNGILNGSYTQSSCKEYLGYDKKKEQVISYNIPQSNPFIQPKPTNTIQNNITTTNTYGGTSSRGFGGSTRTSIISLINGYSYVKPSTPTYGERPFTDNANGNYIGGNPPVNGVVGFTDISSPNSSSSTTRDGTTCTTPRGTELRNGQFVKAYKMNNGFTNLPCEVELRYCVQQNLQGNFPFQTCTHNDIAVEDFLDSYFDPDRPSLMQLLQTLSNYARTPDFEYEYDSTIDLDRLMDLLDSLR